MTRISLFRTKTLKMNKKWSYVLTAILAFGLLNIQWATEPACASEKPYIIVGKNTPLMGWASWNNFRANISETILKAQVDGMVKTGLQKAGYRYFNIEDGFFAGRDDLGNLITDRVKFPKGMKDMADYIHSKGLKAGIYSEAGSNTCGSIWDAQKGGINAGMYTRDQKDVNLFFKTWGFDYIKVDYCGGQKQALDEQERYTAIKNAIIATGRKDIQYNVCRWEFPGTWVLPVANSWRISHDLFLRWSSVIEAIDKNTFLAAYASAGHYNDMDMLQVGRGFTADEDKAHFTLWAILSSPLLLGNDLTQINDYTLSIITNEEIIALNQDTTGLQAQLVRDNGKGLQVFAKALNGKQSNERAVVLFNRNNQPQTITFSLNDINLYGPATLRDLWRKADLGQLTDSYTTEVPAHGVVALKIKGKNKLKEIFEGETAFLNNFNHLKYSRAIPEQARAERDSSCSGLAKAARVGNNLDNWMEFRDIIAPASGRYSMNITYLCSEDKTLHIKTNDDKPQAIKALNSGGPDKTATISIPVFLQKGQNKVRFFNNNAYIPDIDKISFAFLLSRSSSKSK